MGSFKDRFESSLLYVRISKFRKYLVSFYDAFGRPGHFAYTGASVAENAPRATRAPKKSWDAHTHARLWATCALSTCSILNKGDRVCYSSVTFRVPIVSFCALDRYFLRLRFFGDDEFRVRGCDESQFWSLVGVVSAKFRRYLSANHARFWSPIFGKKFWCGNIFGSASSSDRLRRGAMIARFCVGCDRFLRKKFSE